MTTSKSLVPPKSLRTNDGEEGISDDHISSTYKYMVEGPPHQSSTPSSIESSFEEFEDLLLNS
ncbi:hypothetical protein MA16_Dca010567 [Dendrobium catenatum]|uniref:Uncharacterized protein n=1 Tax=Dendrobium catenatum TaxID=906689 RepID=A0A2I0XF38_9ASPA|nr:hypothetical protein MA16_Dca010567 [Dendrobium catenatum]